MIVVAVSRPKYRPSRESLDRRFMRKTSPPPMRVALPNWQRSATTVAIECLGEIGAIDGDHAAVTTDRLPWKRRDTFQHRHPDRQAGVPDPDNHVAMILST